MNYIINEPINCSAVNVNYAAVRNLERYSLIDTRYVYFKTHTNNSIKDILVYERVNTFNLNSINKDFKDIMHVHNTILYNCFNNIKKIVFYQINKDIDFENFNNLNLKSIFLSNCKITRERFIYYQNYVTNRNIDFVIHECFIENSDSLRLNNIFRTIYRQDIQVTHSSQNYLIYGWNSVNDNIIIQYHRNLIGILFPNMRLVNYRNHVL